MRVNRNILVGTALTTGLFLSSCADDDSGAEKQPEKPKTGVEHDDDRFTGIEVDDGWKLVTVTAVGESELYPSQDDQHEATFFRFSFELGNVAVSCLVDTNSDIEFPDSGIIDPRMCFIDGDPLQPLAQTTPGSR